MSPLLQYHPMFLRNTIDIVPQYEQQQQQQHEHQLGQKRRRPYALQLSQAKRPSWLGSLQSIIAAFKEQKHDYRHLEVITFSPIASGLEKEIRKTNLPCVIVVVDRLSDLSFPSLSSFPFPSSCCSYSSFAFPFVLFLILFLFFFLRLIVLMVLSCTPTFFFPVLLLVSVLYLASSFPSPSCSPSSSSFSFSSFSFSSTRCYFLSRTRDL